MPVSGRVQPHVHRDAAFGHSQAAKTLGHESERGAEGCAREGILLALARRDEHLVRTTAGEGTEEGEPVAFRDDADAVLELLHEDATEDAAALICLRLEFLRHERRLLLQPDELRVRVLQTCASRAPLVDERLNVREALLARGGGARLPGLGDELELAE